jgi:hypothetical protein
MSLHKFGFTVKTVSCRSKISREQQMVTFIVIVLLRMTRILPVSMMSRKILMYRGV